MNENNNTILKGKIEFKECYSLYRFIDAISSLTDEIPVIVDSYNNQLVMRFMDASRICLIEAIFTNPHIKTNNTSNLKTFLKVKGNVKKEDDTISKYNITINSGGKRTIDTKYLKNLLKVKKNDEKSISIVFEDKCILIEKKAYGLGIIKKKLRYTDIQFDDISIGSLSNIDYQNSVEISQKLLNDFFYEVGNYSEIIGVEIDKKGICFTENSVVGNSEIFYESKLLSTHIVSTKSEKGMYSLYFLNLIKPIVNIMEEKDVIKFELKSDHPLKVSIKFDKIGVEIIFYLAARVSETELKEE